MANRRAHSSIDRLPADLRDALTRMIVDNEWPADFPFELRATLVPDEKGSWGNPRYEDLVAYAKFKGFQISESSIGRFGMRMRTLARMKQAGVITRDVMKDLTNEKASETQKAVAEMITATAIEFISDHDKFGADEIRDVAKAMKDCTAIAINADKYIREQLSKKIATAAASTKDKLSKAGVPTKLIQEIIDEHLGVTKS